MVEKKYRQSQEDKVSVPVVSTKLNKPVLPQTCITRSALIDDLEHNLHLPLTLVSAPTGTGKSILFSQWLDKTDHQYGWLSLDSEHNDMQVLLAYFLAMFKKLWLEKTFGLENIITGSNIPLNVIISTLINDIGQYEDQFILVLDDYHLIQEKNIHQIFIGILSHPPVNFKLVIITQIDPPLMLARLRAKLQVHDIRMKDLAFTDDEALELRALIASKIPRDEVKILVNKSEGWITGVTVGMMGLSAGIELEKVLLTLHSRNSIIAELLDEAVLHGLPIGTQKYLEIATLVDQFNADLLSVMIDAIDDEDLEQVHIEELIRRSRKNNLFLIPLDDSNVWFRFHHLFQSQIKKRAEKHFGQKAITALYKAASSWFEENGTLEDALRYAILSKDMSFAVHLFAGHRTVLHNAEQIQRLERLIRHFPEEAKNNSVDILLSLAILQDFTANFTLMHQCLSRAKELLENHDIPEVQKAKWLGEYHAVSTFLAHMNGDLEQSMMHADKAMELLPADEPNFFREYSAAWYSFAQQSKGNYNIGLDRLDREFQSLTDNNYYFQRRLMQSRCISHLLEGSISSMASDGTILSNISSPKNFPAAWMIGIYSVACSSYLCDELINVGKYYDDLRQFQYVGWPFWVMHHYFLVGLSEIARGNWQEADLCLDQCEELADELDIDPITGMVNAFKVEFYLRRNELDRAIEISRFANFEPIPPMFYYYIPQLTQVKLLYQTDEKAKSHALLENLLAFARVRHNKNVLIQTLVFKAAFYAEQGGQEIAISLLNEALSLTDQMDHIRTYVDHGPVLQNLIKEIAAIQQDNKQVIRLLKVFEDDSNSISKSVLSSHEKGERHASLLSKREFEILSCVKLGLQNNEIADQLFISTDTVKKHLYRAFQKLDVKNRTAAVNKLKVLGLFTDKE